MIKKSVIIPIVVIVLLLPFTLQSQSLSSVKGQVNVNKSTGDLSYTLPLLSVPGPGGSYPISLSYSSGIKVEQQASWVGLGWNLSAGGAIYRSVNGAPDDRKSAEIYIPKYNERRASQDGYKIYKDNVWGTLYYKEFFDDTEVYNETVYPDGSTEGYSLENEENYSSYMDTYYQPAGEDNGGFYYPNYDNYFVSAQGITGNITPFLFEYNCLINQPEISENKYKYIDKNVYYQKYFTNEDGSHWWVPGMYNPLTQLRPSKEQSKIYFQYTNELNPEHTFSYSTIGMISDETNYVHSYIFPSDETPSIKENVTPYYNKTLERNLTKKYIQYYTNQQIIDGQFGNLIQDDYIKTNRNTTDFVPDGIGGFIITDENGNKYHFSIPVYAYEKFEKSDGFDVRNQEYISNYSFEKYAYKWLLTAITYYGYVDKNGNGIVDDEDEGTWVKFNYGKWTDAYPDRQPITGTYPNSNNFSFVRNQIYYLNSIETKTHKAFFVKDVRQDGLSSTGSELLPVGNKYYELDNTTGVESDAILERYFQVSEAHKQLYLKKIFLIEKNKLNTNNIIIDNNNGSLINQLTYNLKYSLNSNSILSAHGQYDENVLDVYDIGQVDLDIRRNANLIIDFDYDYSLAVGTPDNNNVNEGRLTLTGVNYKKLGDNLNNENRFPKTEFTYYNVGDYDKNKTDDWGYYTLYGSDDNGVCNDYTIKDKYTDINKSNQHNWSIKEILNSDGTKTKIEYEKDEYSKVLAYESDNAYFYKENDIDWHQRIIISCPQFQSCFNPSYTSTINTTNFEIIGVLKNEDGEWIIDISVNDDIEKIEFLYENNFPLTVAYNNEQSVNIGPVYSILINTEFPADYFIEKVKIKSINTNNTVSLIVNNLPMHNIGESNQMPYIFDYIGFNISSEEFESSYQGGGIRVSSITKYENEQTETGFKSTYDYDNGVTTYVPSSLIANIVPFSRFLNAPNVVYGEVTESKYDLNNMKINKNTTYFNTTYSGISTKHYRTILDNAYKITRESSLLGQPVLIIAYDKNDIKISEIKYNYKTFNEFAYGEMFSQRKYNLNLIEKYANNTDAEQYTYLNTFASIINIPNSISSIISTSDKGVTKEIYNYDEIGFVKKTIKIDNTGDEYQSDYALSTLTQNKSILYGGQNLLGRKKMNQNFKKIDNSFYMINAKANKYSDAFNVRIWNNLKFEDITNSKVHIYKNYSFITERDNNGAFGSDFVNFYHEYKTPVEVYTSLQDYENEEIVYFNLKAIQYNFKFTIYDIYHRYEGETLKVTFKREGAASESPIEIIKDFIIPEDAMDVNGSINITEEGTYSIKYEVLNNDNVNYRPWTHFLYVSNFSINHFDPLSFNENLSDNDLQTQGWELNSTITRYDEFSRPIETLNKSGLYSAVKFGYKGLYPIAKVSGANYTSFAYSGFEKEEELDASFTSYDGEVYSNNAYVTRMASYDLPSYERENCAIENGIIAHTGKFYQKINIGTAYGSTYKSYSGVLPGRKYVASVWIHETSDVNTRLVITVKDANGGDIGIWFSAKMSDAIATVNGWKLVQVEATVPNGTLTDYQLQAYIWNHTDVSTPSYVDDFRVHPADAPMTSYVYNNLGAVEANLDIDNFATIYKYDNSGRIIEIWQESAEFGLVKVKSYQYNFGRDN